MDSGLARSGVKEAAHWSQLLLRYKHEQEDSPSLLRPLNSGKSFHSGIVQREEG